jgi:hypothetical protein
MRVLDSLSTKKRPLTFDELQGREWTQDELDQAAQRGDFPRRPSDLFLKVSEQYMVLHRYR